MAEIIKGLTFGDTTKITVKPSKTGRFFVNYEQSMVIAEIKSDIELLLLSNSSTLDDSWVDVIDKKNYKSKIVLVDEVTFFNNQSF